MLSVSVHAQTDSFFNYGEAGESPKREGTSFGINGVEFGVYSMVPDQDLPLGSGLVLLVGAGLGYVLLKRKEESK